MTYDFQEEIAIATHSTAHTLHRDFERIASSLEEKIPEVWGLAVQVLEDKGAAIGHLTDDSIEFFQGKSPLQTIMDENSVEPVVNNLNALEYGVYM